MTPDLPALERVLDAASTLVIDKGFDNADLATIASKAGTSEAALTRMFGTVNDLFVSMLNREFAAMYRVILDNVERDPRGGLLSRVYLYSLSAVYERPLARALYITDPSTLNAIMRNSHGFTYIPSTGVRSVFIESMQAAGMVRRDIDAPAISYVLSTFSAGLALTAPHEDLDLVIRGISDMLARSVDADVTDTSPGKRAFYDYATSLTLSD